MNNPYALAARGKVDHYFASETLSQTFGTDRPEVEVPFYYRTFEQWVTAFSQAGFLLHAVVDVPPPTPIRPSSARRIRYPRSC